MPEELSGEGIRLGLWVVVLGLPLLLTLATAFTKSTVVLGALRLGLGAEALLPAPVILSLALVVTAIVMAPTAAATQAAIEAAGGLDALLSGPISDWRPVADPLLDFVGQNADPAEVSFFADLGGRGPGDPTVVVPAFLATELTEALQMAVVILLPFVVVDLLAAQALALAGITPPSSRLVTVPLKILLFLAVGGWDVVIGGLAQGYA